MDMKRTEQGWESVAPTSDDDRSRLDEGHDFCIGGAQPAVRRGRKMRKPVNKTTLIPSVPTQDAA